MTAERISPSAELLVAWLCDRLKVRIERKSSRGPGITEARLDTDDGPIMISRHDGRLATFTSPGRPDRPVALKRRNLPELLAEELRRLDEDDVYAATARKLVRLHLAMTTGPVPRVEVHESAADLATSVAGAFLRAVTVLQDVGEIPRVALTGGTIADAIHREIARLGADTDVDWSRIDFFWGDERFVAPDSPDRNALQAREAFLDLLGVDPARVHEIPSTADAASVDAAAASYADTVRGAGTGHFHVLMLGVGPDGHIASLFPGHPQLDVDDLVAVGVHRLPEAAAGAGEPDPPGAEPGRRGVVRRQRRRQGRGRRSRAGRHTPGSSTRSPLPGSAARARRSGSSTATPRAGSPRRSAGARHVKAWGHASRRPALDRITSPPGEATSTRLRPDRLAT